MEVRSPPPKKRGISAILARYPLNTRQTFAIPPCAILSRKGIAQYGGLSRTGPLRAWTMVSDGCSLPNTGDRRTRQRLRAKGTLISEPRFSTPREMRFFPREKGETALIQRKTLELRPFPLSRVGKSHLAGGRKSGLTN